MSKVIKSTHATIQNGAAKSDGKLTLSEWHISFEPYNKQLGLGPYCYERSQILSVKKSKAKGAGILPLSSDAIEIQYKDNQSQTFILASKDEWLALLSVAS